MNLSEKECAELLPWYVNGTLSADEKKAVELLLEQSISLREELQKLKTLAQHLPERQQFSGAELGWRRLRKQIQAEHITAQQPMGGRNNWSRVAAIAALLVLTVQIGFFALMPREQSASPELLSRAAVQLEPGEYVLQLQLASDASWQEVVTLVTALNGDVVQGPGASGIVRVRFNVADVVMDGNTAPSIDAVMIWLQQQAIVQHVALEGGAP